MLRNAKVKDLIYFGDTYWYITSKTSDKCTIISKKNVCEKPYNNEDKDITWEKCSLRTWLNESYYGNFSQYEKSLISKTKCVTNDTIENSNGYSWHTKGGNATEDYIYLLSTEEAESLDKSIRKNGDYWVLRSPGLNQNDNRAVNPDGEICFLGGNVASDRGIRPALTIDLSKIKK